MQGLFLDDSFRFASKKAVREMIAFDPSRVRFEATSYYGGEYAGTADELPAGHQIYFCGPDVYHDRRFYGTITRDSRGALRVR